MFMRHCLCPRESLGSWKTHVDADLWLFGKYVWYSYYLPDSPNDALTYSSLCETSSVEVPLSITPPAVLFAP